MSKKIGPWTQIKTEIAYENPWIKVSHEKVINPNGGEGIYGKVHFKNIAVGVIPLFKDGTTILVGQFRYPLNRYSWEIPEGGCPHQEKPEEAAKRELREETGIECNKLRRIAQFDISNSVSDEVAELFLATDLKIGESQPDETEQLELKRIHITEAISMVHAGEITDSLSVIAIQNIELQLLKNELSF
jgi:8-oxo-dGTP pyrophosphatase MutT (NUDIX family)